jgi:membrane-anchored glycerophosphoryl diester phosphodiesterase (GDPDase)
MVGLVRWYTQLAARIDADAFGQNQRVGAHIIFEIIKNACTIASIFSTSSLAQTLLDHFQWAG